MDTYTESEFSDPCFIVAGTQSKDGSNDKQGNGYGVTKLKALNCVEGTCPSPERADSPVIPLQAPIDMILKGKGGPCIVTAANGDDSVKKTGNSAGQSSQTGSHTSSSGSVSGTASDRAPGGGGGGDGRDEDEHDHIRNGSHGDVEVDDDEEEEEEQGLGRNNLLPPLNHPSGHILVGGESSHESDVDRARPAILASDTATDTTIPETVSESEGGGISDAPTVVVSDTEGHGQRFSTSVSPAFAGLVPSPATGRFVPERECSSVENTSTLSSITSCYSSSDDQRAADGISKKRGPGKWSLASNEQFLYQGGISRKIYTSSETSPEKSQNQRKTIRKEKLIRTSGTSLLLSKENQGASQAGVAERENFISSQQDLFHETETAPPSTEDQIIGTPAETIGSLQFSQTHLVPETLEDSQSLNYIPPSPDAYGSAPLIVPDSPTADVKVHFEESDHNETPEIVDVIPAPEKDEDKKTSIII